MIAFHAVQLVAPLQHAIELVDQHRNGLVALVRLHGCIHVGTVDLDVPLGFELHADRRGPVAFQFHAETHDALPVTEQSVGFLPDERLERWGEVQVDAGDD